MTRPGPTSCAHCGAPIEQNSRGTKLYCDALCRARAGRDRRRPERRQRCKLCRRKVPAPTAKGGMPPLYCGPKCRRRAKTLRAVGYTTPPTTCTRCGGPMEATYRTRRYCGDACRSAARRAYLASLPPPPPPPPSTASPRERLVLLVGWPGAASDGFGPQWRKWRAA